MHLEELIAERIAARVLHHLEREFMRMTDAAITNLTNATDGVVAEFTTLINAIQTEAAALAKALTDLAAAGTALDPAIQAQADRLNVAAGAASAALAAITPPPA